MPIDEAWKKVYDQRAKEHLPEHARSYWSKKGYEQLLKLTEKYVLESGIKGTLLDVGCGNGRYCKILQDHGFDVLGIDYSDKVIELAKKNYPGIRFEVKDAYNTEFQDQAFDIVICVGVLQCVHYHEKLLNELSRITKKVLILSTLHRDDDIGMEEHFADQLKDDEFPAREYKPEEVTTILDKKDFKSQVILKEEGQEITDGFFVIAERTHVI
jgi:2-polyprenyl-3-methyl-5-hydroxy-6-metoxy-1,4-benzoquinol methylase